MSKSKVRQELVKNLIDQFPYLTENYNLLVSHYWKYVEGANGLEDVGSCSSAEAITRAFRRLVQSGKVVVPDEVREKRQQYQESFKEDYQPI